ncbi:MAG: hypothetical protein JWP65_544 [Ramlibacter sp.]|uniref:hypothetical protein n=1 Tax=Ramlibacter sp. TaxID=1917967 RepID=UPI00262CE129|nr:hypothetical protein [Ramlibacter sp.]MDB5750123.1 hypothetical protein [Ramlibacter sp.]
MVILIAQLATALGLALGCALLDVWWGGAGPLAFELWLTWLPALAVGAVLPTGANGLLLVALVLAAQHLLLVRLLVLVWARLRPQSSSPASSPGNSTSVKPNWLKSRTRIG